MATLIAEDLLLLLLDDESGQADQRAPTSTPASAARCWSSWRWAARRGRSSKDRAAGPGRRSHTTVDRAARGPACSRRRSARVAEKERTAQDLVGRLGQEAPRAAARAARGRGHPRARGRAGCWGCSPARAGPRPTRSHEREVRRRARRRAGARRRPRAAHRRPGRRCCPRSDLAHKVVDARGHARDVEVKTRAKEIAEGDWAAKAVKDAVPAAQAAVDAAAAVAATASTAATSGCRSGGYGAAGEGRDARRRHRRPRGPDGSGPKESPRRSSAAGWRCMNPAGPARRPRDRGRRSARPSACGEVPGVHGELSGRPVGSTASDVRPAWHRVPRAGASAARAERGRPVAPRPVLGRRPTSRAARRAAS